MKYSERCFVLLLVLCFASLILESCYSGYSLVGVKGEAVPVTLVYDDHPDERALAILCPYKQKIDSIMSPVIGYSSATLTVERPESSLSNLIADILRESAAEVKKETIDIAVMNMGGIRNALPEGKITYGTIYEIAPFENSLCILTMDGDVLIELFSQIAMVHGEGLSGAQLTITEDGRLCNATIGGCPIKSEKTYTVATIDYLAEGNDRMTAFRKAKSKEYFKELLLRDLLLKYVMKCNEESRAVKAGKEGRIQIKDNSL